ncbi:MAG: hypothetical protein ACI8UO_002876 [Verrucomicrobiales bacterium]|jgi:hypothetical protein
MRDFRVCGVQGFGHLERNRKMTSANDPDPLDRLLDNLAAEQLPNAPPNLEANVLRAIRLEAADAGNGTGWPSWLSIPKFAAACVAAAIVFGVTSGMIAVGVAQEADQIDAREALALDVFGAHAPGLPQQLLAQHEP